MAKRAGLAVPGRAATLVLILSLSLLAVPARAQEPSTAGTVEGIVTLPNGDPVEGANVALDPFGTTTTNRRGVFMFRDVSPGNYRLSVQKPGYPAHARRVFVRPGKSASMIIALDGSADPQAQLDRGRIPLRRAGNAFAVKVLLNARREVYLLLDTGASTTVISRALAADLGLKAGPKSPVRRFTTASGTVQAPLVIVPSIQVGETVARNVVVAIHDMPFPDQMPGVLGLSFLLRFKFTIDPLEAYMVLNP
jgi:clan AA aspartic protease (TIGR02281 family)